MPTVRHQRPRARIGDLSELQTAYLLDLPLPEPAGEEDWCHFAFWWICEAHQNGPADAYFRTGKVSLWRKHRAGLEPLWRQLHGRRKHPCDFDPPRCLETAELSARQLHERRLAEARRHQQNR
jgi:hypothetical protein